MSVLTVQQLARISGVTVRTLHYYDEVGLLKPSSVGENGYRYYDHQTQLKLQQILFFKELDFSLEQIKEVMLNPKIDKVHLMEDQKKLLQLKKKRLDKIIKTIEVSIENLKGGEKKMTDDRAQNRGKKKMVGGSAKQKNDHKSDLFEAFDVREVNQYYDEAKERWGKTDAWKQSQERTKHWTKADYDKIKADGDAFMKQFVPKMQFGAGSKEVQEDIEKVYQQLHTFYDPSIEMFRNLGQMYVDDPRFSAYYEKYAPGLAVFMRDAIAIYCDRHEDKKE